MPWIYTIKILDVITVIPIRSWLERREPYRVNSECMQVIEPRTKTFEITDAITIAVHECFKVETVDHRILIPKVFYHYKKLCSTATKQVPSGEMLLVPFFLLLPKTCR